MNFFGNRILGVAIGAALMAGAAATASAQQAQFHLPVEAKWGGVVLPPGDYRMSLPDVAMGRSTFVVHGPAGTSLILPTTADAYGSRSIPPAKDYLQLVNVDGKYFVKKFEEGSRSLTFFFRTPKPSRRVQISENFANIPVSGN